jgi:uncharacterized protein YjdB
VVTAEGAGSATITAASEGTSVTVPVTVTELFLETNPQTVTLGAGEAQQITVTFTNAEGNVVTGISLTWLSSDESVATVSSAGLVTAIAAGSATITGSSRAGSVDVPVTVMELPVASVEVLPASRTLGVGFSTQFAVVLRDLNGRELTGRMVAWSSDNDAVATVDQVGRVSGIAEGTATITAESEGESGAATVAVVIQASNEPAGFTTISEREYVNLARCGDSSTQEEGWNEDEGCAGDNLSIVQVTDAPISPAGVMQFRYPTGFVGGVSPGNSRLPFGGGYSKIYFRYAFKISDNFHGHRSGINKLQHIWVADPVNNRLVPLLYGSDGGPLRFMLALQGDPDRVGRLGANRIGARDVINRGQWYVAEMLVELNTPGVANGVLRYWLDGELIGSYDNIRYLAAGEPNVFFEFMHGPTWGGLEDSAPSTFFLWFDHTYVSAGN